MTETESTLFSKLIREKSLRHPTARNFDPAEWLKAAQTLKDPSDRDIQLLAAAIYYGKEIASLRTRFESQLFPDVDRRTATLLSFAMANYNYKILTEKAQKQARSKTRRDFVHLGLAAQISVESAYPGNESSPDAAIATLVDTLPHCLERANNCASQATGGANNYWELGTRLFSTMSIEHSLRDLWQHILWEDWALRKNADNWRHEPVDRKLATLWAAWIWRHEMILSQGTNLDSINEKAKRLAGKIAEPFLSPTVIGIGGSSRDTRSFRFGPVSGLAFGQAWHRTEHAILEDSYLAPFLDAPLPGLSNVLSCRDLQRVWCVIRDCANILVGRSSKRAFANLDDIEAHALIVRREEVERAIIHCADIGADRVRRAIEFLTCDQFDLNNLFTRGFWSSPLLSIDEGRNLAIAFAPIAVGSAIRRVESWLDRAGLSDHLSDARRGIKYEAWVRNEIREGLSKNLLLPNARCAADSISRSSEGEQVDLLFLLGDLLIVGEIKCLLYPIESIEHFNYLRKLDDAGIQAVRKAQWLIANPETVARALQVSPEFLPSLRAVPIIVTNQGAGFGLEANGARVVDFHFLKLYLSDKEYFSGMAFRPAERVAVRYPETLYRDEKEAANRFETTMADPPPLKRFLRSAVWKDNHFPTSDGQDLIVANCYPGENMLDEAEKLASVLSAKP